MTTRFPSPPQIAWPLQILRAATCPLCLTCGAAPATLAASQRQELRKSTARLDQGVVARHRAAVVLFPQFL